MISLFLAESQPLCPYHIFCRYPPIPDSHTFWIAPHTKYINWKHWSRKHWSRKYTILLNVLFSFLSPAFESFRDLQARSSFCPKQKTFQRTFPNRIQAHSLLHRQPPLQSRTWKKNKKLWNSPKLSFLLKNTLQKYFAAGTRAYKQFARLIPKINIQCQSFSYVNHSLTQAPNIKILFKRDSSSSVRSGLSTVWDRDTTNTS